MHGGRSGASDDPEITAAAPEVAGLELVDPGVTPIQQWRPDTPEEASAIAAMWGGVAFRVLDVLPTASGKSNEIGCRLLEVTSASRPAPTRPTIRGKLATVRTRRRTAKRRIRT
jgi:hypothetical protein